MDNYNKLKTALGNNSVCLSSYKEYTILYAMIKNDLDTDSQMHKLSESNLPLVLRFTSTRYGVIKVGASGRFEPITLVMLLARFIKP